MPPAQGDAKAEGEQINKSYLIVFGKYIVFGLIFRSTGSRIGSRSSLSGILITSR